MSNLIPRNGHEDASPVRADDVSPGSIDSLWRALTDLQARFDEAFGAFGAGMSAHRPGAEVEETDDAYLVEIDLAGVKRSDVEVTTVGRRLTVRGERKERERRGFLRRRTRTVGSFFYDVVLPGDVDADGVSAGMEDGVLTVRLPKPERDRSRRIPVN